MNEAGLFAEDVAELDGEPNIIEELYLELEELAARRREELHQRKLEMREEENEDMEDQVEATMVKEAFIMSYEAHKALKKDLIKTFSQAQSS